jgi:hypothetical protein
MKLDSIVDIYHVGKKIGIKDFSSTYLVQLPPVVLPAVILPAIMVALSPVMFWATAGVVIVARPTTAAAAIPHAAITTAAIKNSFEFISCSNLK